MDDDGVLQGGADACGLAISAAAGGSTPGAGLPAYDGGLPALNAEVVPELDDLRYQINACHEQFCAGVRQTVPIAIKAGRLLIQVKGRLRHGRFKAWVRDNCRFSYRTAADYITLAKRAEELEFQDAAGAKVRPAALFSIKRELKRLAKPRRRADGGGAAGPAEPVTPSPPNAGESGVFVSAPCAPPVVVSPDPAGNPAADPDKCQGPEANEPGPGSEPLGQLPAPAADAAREGSDVGSPPSVAPGGGSVGSTSRDRPGDDPSAGVEVSTGVTSEPDPKAGTEAPRVGTDARVAPVAWDDDPGVPSDAQALRRVRDGLRAVVADIRRLPRSGESAPARHRRLWAELAEVRRGAVRVLEAVSPNALAGCGRCGGGEGSSDGVTCPVCYGLGVIVLP